jgi:hypothetical protein
MGAAQTAVGKDNQNCFALAAHWYPACTVLSLQQLSRRKGIESTGQASNRREL